MDLRYFQPYGLGKAARSTKRPSRSLGLSFLTNRDTAVILDPPSIGVGQKVEAARNGDAGDVVAIAAMWPSSVTNFGQDVGLSEVFLSA